MTDLILMIKELDDDDYDDDDDDQRLKQGYHDSRPLRYTTTTRYVERCCLRCLVH